MTKKSATVGPIIVQKPHCHAHSQKPCFHTRDIFCFSPNRAVKLAQGIEPTTGVALPCQTNTTAGDPEEVVGLMLLETTSVDKIRISGSVFKWGKDTAVVPLPPPPSLSLSQCHLQGSPQNSDITSSHTWSQWWEIVPPWCHVIVPTCLEPPTDGGLLSTPNTVSVSVCLCPPPPLSSKSWSITFMSS